MYPSPLSPPSSHVALPKGNFQKLNKRLLISNDSYMRTTSALHKETSQRLWQICADRGDIYLGKYEVSRSNKRTMIYDTTCRHPPSNVIR